MLITGRKRSGRIRASAQNKLYVKENSKAESSQEKAKTGINNCQTDESKREVSE